MLWGGVDSGEGNATGADGSCGPSDVRMTDEDRLVTMPEVAKMLGLATATVRKMAKRGALPIVRPTGGRAVRIRLSDIRALIARRSNT